MNSKSKINLQDNQMKRLVEKDTSQEELSPMDPPDVYSPQNIESVPYENLHPFLKELVEEHKTYSKILSDFETALINWRNDKWVFTEVINEKLKSFFTFMDENVPLHNQKEEKSLFPLLHKKLIECGEHNSVDSSITSINLMEDEHIKVAQAAAIVFNFLGLGSRLPDKQSKEITFQAAFDQGIAIVETMKLHIFREENILFPQAMGLFSIDEFIKLSK